MAHTHAPEPHFTDTLTRTLIKLYADSYNELLETLARGIRSGRNVRFQRQMLADVSAILQKLRTETQEYTLGPAGDWDSSKLRQAMLWGEEEAEKDAVGRGIKLHIDTGWAKVNELAVRTIARNLAFDLFAGINQVERRVVQYIGRSADDVFRQAQLSAVGRKWTVGLTNRIAKQDMVAKLVDQGLTAFVDKQGREWNLSSYAEMSIRTVSREVSTLGALQRFDGGGIDLVMISTHYPTCEFCATLQGRVFSISGLNPDYPKLDRHPPFHPNCGHVLSAYIPEMDKNREQTKERSNRPFGDDRTKEEVKEYERQQEVKAVQRERRQILAQLKADAVPMSKRMRGWAAELGAPGTTPARRNELRQLLGEHAERWEAGRRSRYRDLGDRLKQLKKEAK